MVTILQCAIPVMDLIVHLSQFYHVSDINIVADEPFPHEL